MTTEAEARESVRKAKQDGYDYLKMTTNLKPKSTKRLLTKPASKTFASSDMPTAVQSACARALKAGQQIEHLDSYLEALLPENLPIKGSVSDIYIYNPKSWESIDYIDESKIPELAKADRSVESVLRRRP